MSQKYYGLVTTKGIEKLRAAAAGTAPLTLSHMAFGDGNGQETAPNAEAVNLINERYRAPLSDKRPHPTNVSILYVEAIIPSGIGGWTLREAGIYDTDGDLIVIAKTPAMDVALLSEGASTEGLVRLPIVFESVSDIEFLIDPTVLLATQSWVIERLIHRPFIVINSITVKAPPVSPDAHALYVVPVGATGAWTGKDNQLAYWLGTWIFKESEKSKVVGASDSGKYYKFTGLKWIEFSGSETDSGFLSLASITETKTGTLKNKAVHPQGVAQTIQSGSYLYAAGTGTTSAITASFSPALAAYTPGMVLRLKMPAASTGVSTLNINELGVKPLVLSSGSPIVKGDWVANEILDLVYDGSQFRIIGKSRMTESVYGATRMATETETKTGTSKGCVTHPFGVAKAVQSGGYVYAVVAGTANALTAALTPKLTTYAAGLRVYFLGKSANTGPVTLAVDGLAAAPITYADGKALAAGEIQGNRGIELLYSGSSWLLLNPITRFELQTPANTKQTSKFTPNVVLTDLNVNAPTHVISITITGTRYADVAMYVGFRNTASSGAVACTGIIRLSEGSTIIKDSQYLGCVPLSGGNQIPISTRSIFQGLNPTKTYTCSIYVTKVNPVGPVNILDPYIIAYHE